MTSMPMLSPRSRFRLDEDQDRVGAGRREVRNPNFGGAQLTAGSNSVRGRWKLLREAGATARAMLVTVPRRHGAYPKTR